MGPDGGSAVPLAAAEFAELMRPFAPFEPQPRLAIAVSGGADSLALALLADAWARDRGGAVTALTVDHRLRPEAAAEAVQVGAWLAARGIAHRCLVWEAPSARRGVQAAARDARYRLLDEWCGRNGVLHLLTAHHRDDQAETLLLRLVRGSGVDGLAGMAPVAERAACRVLRPLLPVPRARLAATLHAAGQEWLEDPSNRDPSYARVRLRHGAALLAGEGLTAERLAATATHLARARTALEDAVAMLLARAVTLHPAGFARVDAAVLLAAPAETALRALAATLTTVGGADYPPRFERLERLHRALAEGFAARHTSGGGRTLGGCRLLPRRDGLLVCREPAAMAPPVAAAPGASVAWDGRFRLRLPSNAPDGLVLGGLGRDALASLPALNRRFLPPAVQASLPVLRDRKGVVSAPHLRYVRKEHEEGVAALGTLFFRPTRPLARARFTVV
jgi:tRNA(Ile)-lysidine synthase